MKKYITLEHVYKKSEYGDNVRRYGSVNLDEISLLAENIVKKESKLTEISFHYGDYFWNSYGVQV